MAVPTMSLPPTMVNVGSFQAPFLAGTMACGPLYGITCAQTAYYYRTYPRDHALIRLLVGILFLVETAHVALLTQAAYFIYVTCKMPENTAKGLLVVQGFAISVTMTAIITIAVQSFYAWRVYSISSRHKVRNPVVAFILATSFAEFCLGLATNAMLFGNPSVDSARGKLQRRLYSATLISTIACDVTISVALVYFLNRMRSGFQSTENVLNRLILFSINVGFLTSAIALCTLVSYYATPPTSLFFALFVTINGKFYVNSMLVTLNSRKSAREIFNRPQSISLKGLTTAQSTTTGGVSSSVPATLPAIELENQSQAQR